MKARTPTEFCEAARDAYRPDGSGALPLAIGDHETIGLMLDAWEWLRAHRELRLALIAWRADRAAQGGAA